MNKESVSLNILPAVAIVCLLAASCLSAQDAPIDRRVLPIPDPVYEPVTELDARDAVAPPPFSVNAPEGAPNVVIVLIDDIGFGASAVFGGAIRTPTLDRSGILLPHQYLEICSEHHVHIGVDRIVTVEL